MATATSHDQVIDFEEYIDQQLVKTSWRVKFVDLVAGLVRLCVFTLGCLLLLVIIDHWVVGLSVGMRFVALAVLVVGGFALFFVGVFRPLVRSINPQYAALAVERAYPGLKNALTSFLFFRDRQNQVRGSIFSGLKEQAAIGLTAAPIETAVDHAPIIRLGYLLVATTAVWCAYILFSPKSPFQTVQRVLTPWREIARPSRVEILAVRPGSTDVFRGQTLEVTAEVHGVADETQPWLEYSTADGQLVAQRLPLTPDGSQRQFAGVLTTGSGGIQQDLRYRIVAGDAMSPLYDVHAKQSPHIEVEKLEFQFPRYTEQSPQTIDGVGDIRGLEGTKVTVWGRANQQIRSGHIEFLPAEGGATPGRARQAPLIVDGDHARVSFTLRFEREQRRSVYRAYRLHFVNMEGLPSVDPVEHTIDVMPDLDPIVELLTPSRRTLEIPENGRQRIEVRAVDPDFKLTRVVLAGRTRGRALFRKELLTTEHTGQFTASFDFVPRQFELQVGDVVEYQVAAEDNRHAPLDGKREPNSSVSWKQYFRITPADPSHDSDEEESNADAASANNEEQAQEEQGGEAANQGGGDQGDEGEAESSGADSQDSNSDSEQGDAGGEEESAKGQDGAGAGLQQSGGSGADAQRQELDSGQVGDASNQDSSTSGAGNQQTDPKGESDDQGDGDSASSSSSDDNGGSSNEKPSSGGGQGEDAEERDPLPSTGERDGEVIDRIRRHMEETGEAESLPESNDTERQEGETSDTQSGGSTTGEDTGASAQPPGDDESGDSKQDPSSVAQPKDQQSSSDKSTATEQGSEQQPPTEDPQGAGSQEQSGNTEDTSGEGSESSRNPTGNPSERPGAPGESGDRHTDAANQADQPGPSPPDGQPPGSESQEAGKEVAEDSPTAESADENRSGQDSPSKADQELSQGNQEDQPQASDADTKSGESSEGQGSPPSDSAGERPREGDESDGKGKEGGDAAAADAGASPTSSGSEASENSSSASKGGPRGAESGTSGSPGSQSDGAADDGEAGTPTGEGQGSGDDANLEYSKKVTDLVLDYLKDQQRKPDPDLLDKLGWEQRDVDSFLRRWADMKQNAQGRGADAENAQRRLDDVLRNLKLTPADSGGPRAAGRGKDGLRNSRNAGRRTRVPEDLLGPFCAFQRSLQRSR